MSKTAKHRCPVVTVGSNGGQVKASAHWAIENDGRGRCLRYKRGVCKLSGASCPLAGEKDFELAFKWENIYKEKYYLGGLHSQGIAGVRT